MPSVTVKLYSVFFKLLLKHRLQSRLQIDSSVSDSFGITSRPEEASVAANPTFSDGVATKDVHIDPLTSLSIRIFLPDVGKSFDPLEEGVYGGYLPNVAMAKKSDKKAGRRLPVILQFHGGGFVSGSSDSFANDFFCRRIAKLCDVIVIAVGYRLAPENRFPAAFEDGVKVLNWLGKQANLAECGKSMGNIRGGGLGGSDTRRSEMHHHVVDAFGASMVEPWLAAHCDPSRSVS